MLGICQREGEMRQAWSLMVVAFFALFSQIGSMALPIFLERIELESCACAQIKTLEDGSGRFHPDEAGDPSEKERNAANLISDGGCFFSNRCHGSFNIS